jgi:hypothetical protein
MQYKWASAGLAGAHWGCGIALAALGWLVGALGCDEGCSERGEWSRDGEAWQWDAVELLSLSLIAILTFFSVALLTRRLAVASTLFAIQIALTLAIVSFLAAAESVRLAPGVTLLVVATEVCGLLALFLRARD